MDTHAHLHFDPLGADISKFMHCLNLSYAQYYNIKYRRHGHVFQFRFGNKVITTDENNLAVSFYIHNNAKAITDYRDRVHEYPLSSFGIYLGIYEDNFAITSPNYILEYFSLDKPSARKLYYDLVISSGQAKDGIRIDPENMFNSEYRSERKVVLRDIDPKKVIAQVAKLFHINNPDFIKLKSTRQLTSFRAVSVFFLRGVCNLTYKQICDIFGDITLSGIARLSSQGFVLMKSRNGYAQILSSLMPERMAG